MKIHRSRRSRRLYFLCNLWIVFTGEAHDNFEEKVPRLRSYYLCTFSFLVETKPEGFRFTGERLLDRKTLRVLETANIMDPLLPPEMAPTPTPTPTSDMPPARSEAWWLKIQPESRWFAGRAYLLLKRIFDLGMIVFAAPFILPLLLLCALMLKLESPEEPVLVRQVRQNGEGRRFLLLRFRTWALETKGLTGQLFHLNEGEEAGFAVAAGAPVTRVGWFLWRAGLVELPQLGNVLRGDMSFVGPHLTFFTSKTYERLPVKPPDLRPGLTGLWQVAVGRSVEFAELRQLDLAYAERRCFWLDLQILLRTVTAVFRQQDLYTTRR